MRHVLRCLLSFTLCTTIACGDDDTSSADAAMVDASPPDAFAKPDAADPCIDYCECMPSHCPTQYESLLGGSPASCMQICGALMTNTQRCRAYHCSVAVGEASATHCPHAVGQTMCIE